MPDKKSETEAFEYVRDSIARLMKMTGHKTYGITSKNISFAFQNAISQIPDDIISHLIDQPNDKLIVYTRKPQNNETTNASNEANRRRHTP